MFSLQTVPDPPHFFFLALIRYPKSSIEFRDRVVELRAGEFLIVPCGVEHRPVADEEVEVLLFEPATTLNTGNAGSDRTATNLQQL